MSMFLHKFYLGFNIYVLFAKALSILLKSLAFRILIIVKDGKFIWQIDGDKVNHLFKCNHDEADTRMVLHAY